jgi:hypothetical protein
MRDGEDHDGADDIYPKGCLLCGAGDDEENE